MAEKSETIVEKLDDSILAIAGSGGVRGYQTPDGHSVQLESLESLARAKAELQEQAAADTGRKRFSLARLNKP